MKLEQTDTSTYCSRELHAHIDNRERKREKHAHTSHHFSTQKCHNSQSSMKTISKNSYFKCYGTHTKQTVLTVLGGDFFPFSFSWVLDFWHGKYICVVLFQWWSDKNCLRECALTSKQRPYIQNRIWAIFRQELSENSNEFSSVHVYEHWA